MKVLIHDDETGELLLQGDLSLSHIKQFLATSLLVVHLVDYVPTNPVVADYKHSDIGWTYDSQMDLWIQVSTWSSMTTYKAVLPENVPLPAEITISNDLAYRESQRATF